MADNFDQNPYKDNCKCLKNEVAAPNFYKPPMLSSLAANAVVKLIVYEDYHECNFYRCDPVRIWEFEIHQPKKKKGKKIAPVNALTASNIYGHPQPPWKELLKFRNWWCDNSLELLGQMPASSLRCSVINALEKQSWISQSPEEDTLFLLLRLCIDTQIHFSVSNEIPLKSQWFQDLIQILNKLGPFPLLKLTVGDDIFAGDTSLLCAIIQNSPNLQVLRIGQWELHNDILLSLGSSCPQLVEFEIRGMEPDVFMSDDAFFRCFFQGCSGEQVLSCFKEGRMPPRSFNCLKYVDILLCRHTERLLQMLAIFYSGVAMNALDACSNESLLTAPFIQVGASMPFLRVSTSTQGILDERLREVVRHSSRLKTLMIHIDDCFPGADLSSVFERRMETAAANLKSLVDGIPTLEALVFRPHEEVDFTNVALSTFGASGHRIKSFTLIYDFSSVNTNSIFQLLNLCPELTRLVVDVNSGAEDVASLAFVTNLKVNPSLETFVLLNDQTENTITESGNEENLAFSKILLEVVGSSPNLVNLSFRLEDRLACLDSLYSASVERLHLNLSNDFRLHWVADLLPKFPNLKSVSVEGSSKNLWPERLHALSKSSINVTKKKPEFVNVVPWEKKKFSTEPMQIMVM